MVEWKVVRLPDRIKYLLEVNCSKDLISLLSLVLLFFLALVFLRGLVIIDFLPFVFKDPAHLPDLKTVVCLSLVSSEEE